MTPELDRLPEIISTAVGQVHSIEPYAAADLAAWVLGDLLCRVSDARKEPEHRYDVAIGCAGIYDAIEGHQESWFMPRFSWKASKECVRVVGRTSSRGGATVCCELTLGQFEHMV